MNDDPYSPPETRGVRTDSWADVVQRTMAMFLYLVAWALAAYLTGPVLNEALGGLDIGFEPAESQLTMLQSFNRFASMYWFTGFIMIGIPVSVIVWFVLRRKRRGPTRWAWLGICSALILPELILAWLVFRPLLFGVR